VGIFGFSLGGITALRLAIGHPEPVRKLVTISVVYRNKWRHLVANGPRHFLLCRAIRTAGACLTPVVPVTGWCKPGRQRDQDSRAERTAHGSRL
jgi:pimeloyl-ACP methyl ester carboxylesterase